MINLTEDAVEYVLNEILLFEENGDEERGLKISYCSGCFVF